MAGRSVDCPRPFEPDTELGACISFAWYDTFSSTVADMQNMCSFGLDGEEYAVMMRFPSVEELTDFKRETYTFGGDWTSFRKFG